MILTTNHAANAAALGGKAAIFDQTPDATFSERQLLHDHEEDLDEDKGCSEGAEQGAEYVGNVQVAE